MSFDYIDWGKWQNHVRLVWYSEDTERTKDATTSCITKAFLAIFTRRWSIFTRSVDIFKTINWCPSSRQWSSFCTLRSFKLLIANHLGKTDKYCLYNVRLQETVARKYCEEEASCTQESGFSDINLFFQFSISRLWSVQSTTFVRSNFLLVVGSKLL